MTLHVVTRSVVALAIVARGGVAQEVPPPSGLTSLVVNAARPSTDTWVRAGKSAAVILKQPIALDLRNVPLNDALGEISRAALVTIQRGPDVLASRALVSLHVAGLPIADALATVLDGTGLAAYVSLGGDAVLVARPPLDEPAAHNKRLQDTRITGRVLDAANASGVPAASVVITGTTIGVNTTDSGTFALNLPADAKSLIVRRIGYLAQTVAIVTGKTDYTITLQRDVLHLEAQVVTGVATTVSSQNAANAVSTITAQSVNEIPSPTIENSLEGKVPGAIIQNLNGGAPGGGVQIQVRGITSINGNTEPLYVVDGVIVNNSTVDPDINAISRAGNGTIANGFIGSTAAPSAEDNGVNRIADLNTDDIESVEILKGASASAIYGSKGSAGVIVITTKRGTSGKPKWEVNTQLGQYQIMNEYPLRQFPTLASAQTWYVNDVTHDAAPAAVAADNAFIQGMYAGPQNYQRQLFGNSQASYSADVSVSGTQGGTQYFVSGLAKYDNGIMMNTGYNKQSVRSNITQQFASTLSVSANLNYIHDITRRGVTGNDNTGIAPYDVFSYTPAFMSLNKLTPAGTWPINQFGQANPFADAVEIATPEALSRFIGGGSINWTPWKTEHQSLQVNFTGGADLASLNDQLYAPPYLQVEQEISTGLPGSAVSNTSQTNYYNYQINLIHHWTGLSWLDATTSVGYLSEGTDFTNPVTVGYNLLSNAQAPTVGTVTESFFTHTATRDQTLYAQEQLITLDSRLSVTAGITAERSTNDADINRFYYYPRYNASYRIPRFASFLDELKIRAAYGQSGNLSGYGNKYTPFVYNQIDGLSGVAVNPQLGDPSLKPETEQETEMGFDATMFHSRAQFSFTVYSKVLTNLLLQAGVAPSYGYGVLFLNGGQFTNQGIELQLTTTPVQLRNGFNWVATTSFFRNYSVVNALPEPPFDAANAFGFGEDVLAPGRSVTNIVNPNFTQGNGLNPQVGDFSAGDFLSFSNAFSWHGFRLSGLTEWQVGGNTVNLTDLYFGSGPQLGADSTYLAKQYGAFKNGQESYVESAAYFEVRELTFSYDLPTRWLNRFASGRIASARLSVSGYNLWGIWKYHGLDPQVTATGNESVGRGIDITPYPPARSVFFGLVLGL